MPSLRFNPILTPAAALVAALAVLSLPCSAAAQAAPAAAPQAGLPPGHFAGAQDLFHCSFDAALDAAADSWPDHWTRERSATHPPYLEMRIDEAAPPGGGHSLRIDLDGGAAAINSPPIPANILHTYVFQCQVKTEGLVHNHASLSVTFYDAQNKALERLVSAPLGGTSPWTPLQIGPIAPSNPLTDHAVIGLSLDPTERADLKGAAWFADVWAGGLPRLTVAADRADHLYLDVQHPEVRCNVSGFNDPQAAIACTLLDVDGRELVHEKVPLELEHTTRDPATRSGHALWQPPLPGPGFYRVLISLADASDPPMQHDLTLAIIHDQAPPPLGEFGWTAPDGESPFTLPELGELAARGGIHWLKFPLWDCGPSIARCDAVLSFADRLTAAHIQLIGLLTNPPDELRKQLGAAEQPLALQIFSAKTDVWFPSLEPIVAQLSRQIHWWQLGQDDDFSFAGAEKWSALADRVRTQLACYGQRAHVGVAWPAGRELPTEMPGHGFLALAAEPQPALSSQAGTPADQPAANTTGAYLRLVNINPLPAAQFSPPDRARDLSERMIFAKLHHFDGIFIPQLCSTSRGLMNDDGSAGELLLPWRTTALSLAGAKLQGSLMLPGGSTNYAFTRDQQLVLVLWNQQAGAEQLALGDKARLTDLWGRVWQPPVDDQGQCHVVVDRLPIFLTDLDAPLVQWQLTTSLDQPHLSSELGAPVGDAITITNPYPQSVTGVVRLSSTQRWRLVPREIPFKLAAGESKQLPFEVTLPFDASSGPQQLRLDFDLAADRRRQFSVYRPVAIGDDEVTIEPTSHVSEEGDLVVEQKLVNKSDRPVSFKCSLFAVDRRRMTTQVIGQGRGSDVQTYRLPKGRDLVGQTLWLRAEELDGRRTLNYRFVAQP